ncbi:MAG: T9SS type A sorting domain-containing protein [Bacteroidales bacterium]|nr:T9SS type A sorting domain-containing protein [Bacteroidales bacterium]
MKKLLSLSLLALMCASVFAQQVVLTFTGRDATTNAYVQLSRIEITDLTQGWTETLIYPDTTAILTVGTGISDYAVDGSFGLAQNNPNPFNGATDVNLTVAEPGAVTMEITDVNGKIVETHGRASLQPGTHQFRINVANAGVYFLTARQNGRTSSVKMVNNGKGTDNGIEYVGSVETLRSTALSKNATRGAINRAFAYGDAMTYKGFASVDGEEIEGEIVAQTQILSETIILLVDYSTVINPNEGIPCPGTPTLTDVDGNTYNTVQIGNQCWMKENLRTTMYADETSISQGSTASTGTAYWYYPNNSSSDTSTYGLLYNWAAVMRNLSSSTSNPSGIQGICPNGWHVPSDAEWTQLTDYVSSQSQYRCSGGTSSIAKALASTTGWNSSTNTCAVGNNPSSNNATGFGAFPAGLYNGSYFNFGDTAFFWSTTEDNSDRAYDRELYSSTTGVYRDDNVKHRAYSVRCVRD